MEYSRVRPGQHETLVIRLGDTLETVSSTHPSFHSITAYLDDGGNDPAHLRKLLDARGTVTSQLRRLSNRVAFNGRDITFDGDVINTALSRHILRMLRENTDGLRPAVLFMEGLAENPSPLSRRHLWKWIAERDFTLTPDGHIIGYKAVCNSSDNRSITSGTNVVTVNDHEYTGQIPNPIGARVRIGRAAVDPDRNRACSTGLHVGTWNYAEEFGGPDAKILTVSVHPRDVVAVPRDHDDQKMRVCGYTVLSVTHMPHQTPVLVFDPFDEDEDEFAA